MEPYLAFPPFLAELAARRPPARPGNAASSAPPQVAPPKKAPARRPSLVCEEPRPSWQPVEGYVSEGRCTGTWYGLRVVLPYLPVDLAFQGFDETPNEVVLLELVSPSGGVSCLDDRSADYLALPSGHVVPLPAVRAFLGARVTRPRPEPMRPTRPYVACRPHRPRPLRVVVAEASDLTALSGAVLVTAAARADVLPPPESPG